MDISATREDAYRLLHEGSLALADVERNGIAIDVGYGKNQLKKIQGKKAKVESKLNDDREIKKWKKFYGKKFNLDSNPQLAQVLYKVLKYKPTSFTKTEQPSVDKEALSKLDSPMIKKLLRYRRYIHLENKITEVLRETVDGLLHPSFNLHLAKTYRSSSDHINFQNQDVRDKISAEIIRRLFIARKDGRKRGIKETDYKGIEVCISCCNHHDPNLIKYIIDKTTDMHRDQALECYMLPASEAQYKDSFKDIRYCGKNKFVFPEFYGDYYVRCAKALWESITIMKLHTHTGLSLLDHLKSKGIVRLPSMKKNDGSSFESHIQKVEDRFWNVKFKDYQAWKEKHWKEYCKRGYFDTLTGFRCSGVMKRNEAINYPVQGPAFHCLLWSLIQVNKQLKKKKMKSLIVGQIHDSMVDDYVEEELDELCGIEEQVMTKDILNHWEWINVPLEIEQEVSKPGMSWFEKEEYTSESEDE